MLNANPENRIGEVVFNEACRKHNSQKGEPCFDITSTITYNVVYFGVCNDRAKRAGMNGAINPESITRGKRSLK